MANKMSIGRYWVGMVSARSAPRANDTVPEEGHMAGLSTATKVASIAALAVLVALGARAALRAYQEREADPRLGDAYTLSVGEDESASDVARRLREDGMIRSETYFTSRVRLAGGSLESGEHELRRGMSVAEIVDAITAGDG